VQSLLFHRAGALSLAVLLLSELCAWADAGLNEIYPRWVAAHGIMIVTPVN
jgi:multimeric flavodoxin WrbA